MTLTLSPLIPLRLYTLPYWSNPPFLIFDIRALWLSGLEFAQDWYAVPDPIPFPLLSFPSPSRSGQSRSRSFHSRSRPGPVAFTPSPVPVPLKRETKLKICNKSAQSNLARGPRRGAVAHVRPVGPCGQWRATNSPPKVSLPVDRSPNPTTCLNPDPSDLRCRTVRIRSAVFPQCTGQTDRPTDRHIVHGKV